MDKDKFFVELRRRGTGLFGTILNQSQVEGIESLLDVGARLPLHHISNVLAQVYHETGGRMSPVRETFADTDAQAIDRLERAWAKGQLTWVKTPYWRDGWFGRGQIQLTHKANYAKFGITNPGDAMKLDVSARVAVEGMRDGKFTGRKLADYNFPGALDNPSSSNPRRIVNGKDGTDAKVAGYHRAFAAALTAAGYDTSPPWRPDVEPVNVMPAKPKWLAGLIAAIVAFFKGTRK